MGLRGGLALFGRFGLAGCLEALELVEGAVEGALVAGFVAAEGFEDAGGGASILAEELSQFLVDVEAGVPGFGVILLVDEADTFLTNNEELRGVFNSGHTRTAAKIIRCVEPDFRPRIFSTFAARVIARIGKLQGTLEDRSIAISLRRKTREEQVERLRRDRLERVSRKGVKKRKGYD